jgi:hypothetical protein
MEIRKKYCAGMDLALDLKGVPVAVFPSGLSRKVTACALYSSLPRNIRLNTHRKEKTLQK